MTSTCAFIPRPPPWGGPAPPHALWRGFLESCSLCDNPRANSSRTAPAGETGPATSFPLPRPPSSRARNKRHHLTASSNANCKRNAICPTTDASISRCLRDRIATRAQLQTPWIFNQANRIITTEIVVLDPCRPSAGRARIAAPARREKNNSETPRVMKI